MKRFLLVLGEERRVYYFLLFPAEVGTPGQRKMRFLGGRGRVSPVEYTLAVISQG